MDDLTIRPAADTDMPWLIDILYDDPPADMRAIEPDVRKAKVVGALVVRAGIDVDEDDGQLAAFALDELVESASCIARDRRPVLLRD